MGISACLQLGCWARCGTGSTQCSSLLNPWEFFSCLLSSRQLPNTFQPLFCLECWERKLCFGFFGINSNLNFRSSVSTLTQFVYILDVSFLFWVILLPDFWCVCGYIFHSYKEGSRWRKVRKAGCKLHSFFPLLSVLVGEWVLTSLWALCHFTPNPLPLESSLLLFPSEIQSRQMAPVNEVKHEWGKGFWYLLGCMRSSWSTLNREGDRISRRFFLGAAAAPSAFPVTEFPPYPS